MIEAQVCHYLKNELYTTNPKLKFLRLFFILLYSYMYGNTNNGLEQFAGWNCQKNKRVSSKINWFL